MKVKTTVLRYTQHWRRQQLAVGGDQDNVGTEFGQLRLDTSRPQAFGLAHRHAALLATFAAHQQHIGAICIAAIEAERLNMFPDGWTEIPGISDSRRGFLMGNALVVGVIERLREPIGKLILDRPGA